MKTSPHTGSTDNNAAADWTLLYAGVRHTLNDAPLIVGRAVDAGLVINDPMVSRMHARISAAADGLVLEDLGSVNGVWVNGQRVSQSCRLHDGDQLAVGGHTIQVQLNNPRSGSRETSPTRVGRDAMATMILAPSTENRTNDARESLRGDSTKESDGLTLLASAADRLLAAGAAEGAERLLAGHLENVLREVQAKGQIEKASFELAARQAVRIGSATHKAKWVEYAFELGEAARRPLPLDVVEQLYTAVRKVPPLRVAVLRSYLAVLRERVLELKPAERFAVQRLQGLEQLVLAR